MLEQVEKHREVQVRNHTDRRRSAVCASRAVQRGASYVEHLVLIGVIALALIGAFRGLQQAYAALSGDEGRAIATLEWARSTDESVGPTLQVPSERSGADESKDSDSKKKCDGLLDCAKEHLKDFGVELVKAAKDDVVGMVTGTVKLAYNLVTDPKGVYEDGKALVDAIRNDPLGALKQLVWDDESSKLWANGDYGGAIGRTFWNVGSNFIPYGGQVAKVSKISKLGKAADEVGDAAKAAEKAEDASKAADGAGDAAKGGEKVDDGSTTAEHGAEKPSDGKKPGEKDSDSPEKCAGGACKRSDESCFVAGTPVHTLTGLSAIEEVMPGDLVWSRDDHTGEIGLRAVVQRFVTPDQPVLSLTIEYGNASIEGLAVTAKHPFWTSTGWTSAKELRVDDRVMLASGASAIVRETHQLAQRTTVYNFEVESFHTYFVGSGGVWVHNRCEPGTHPSGKTQDEFVDTYKEANPTTKYTDDELRRIYDDGNYVINERTGRLNDLRAGNYGPPQVTANYVLDATGKPEIQTLSRDQVAQIDSDTERRANDLAAERQNLLERARGETDEAAKNEYRNKAIIKSEDLGDLAGQVFGKRFEEAGYKYVPTPRGSRTFDRVYTNQSGEVVLLETKGGASTLGDRFGADGETRVQQGTADYVRAVANDIRKTDPDLADIVVDALAERKLKYYEVRQPLTSEEQVASIEAKEFRLYDQRD